MVINHNMSAVNASRTLKFKMWDIDKSAKEMASGMRINTAGDDPSGLAVSEKMRTQIRGLRQAERNVEDGISFIQTTEGYLQETQDILQRIRELSVQASNGIYTDNDRMMIQVEVSQLVDEINRIASYAQFNTLYMLTGRFARPTGNSAPTASMWLHVGANMDERKRMYIGTMTALGLGVISAEGNAVSVSTPDSSNSAIGIVDQALTKVSKQRADLGAYQNRLELTARGIMIGHENITASESRIRDADIAATSVALAKDMILMQANMAILAQDNTRNQGVLQLIR